MGWRYTDIPIIGKQIAKVGKVYDIMQMPCAPTPEIWTLAFFYGIPRLLWSLYKPDPLDETWSRVGRTRGVKRRQKMRYTEEYTNDIKVGSGLRWVRWAGDWVQRIGWWMLIADAATSHALYWTSAAYAFEGCKTPNNPYAQGSLTTPYWEITGDLWQPVSNVAFDNKVFIGGGGKVFIPAGYGYYAGFTVACERIPAFEPNNTTSVVSWRILEEGVGVIDEGETDVSPETGKGYASKAVKKPIIGIFDKVLSFEISTGGLLWTNITDVTVTVTGAGIPTSLGQGDP